MGSQGSDEAEKVRIVSDFILHSPPGEFNEVFNDVRVLLNNDALLKERASPAFAAYNKEQLTPVRVPGTEVHALVTEHNELGGGRFLDPRTAQTFKYDHLRKEGSEWTPRSPPTNTHEAHAEPWRARLDQDLCAYVARHYRRGACAAYAAQPQLPTTVSLVACIEDHQFQPKNYWNGRWRSVWSAQFNPDTGGELRGVLKVQVHYYEDGNVQLVSSKEVCIPLAASMAAEPATAARELVTLIADAEAAYQAAISDNYKTMSDTTFKALRRQLPVTRTKIDWTRIVSYGIAKELKTQ